MTMDKARIVIIYLPSSQTYRPRSMSELALSQELSGNGGKELQLQLPADVQRKRHHFVVLLSHFCSRIEGSSRGSVC
jgi:hypothetical protein